MYLDETIMQSRTTITLVEYIDEIWDMLNDLSVDKGVISHNNYFDIKKKYNDIKEQHEKALKRRSRQYRTDLYEEDE